MLSVLRPRPNRVASQLPGILTAESTSRYLGRRAIVLSLVRPQPSLRAGRKNSPFSTTSMSQLSNSNPRRQHTLPPNPGGKSAAGGIPGGAAAVTLVILGAGGVTAYSLSPKTATHLDTTTAKDTIPDTRPSDLPRFKLSDVRKHDASSEHPWVTYEDKVYDITDWVVAHPGGDVILRAAGGSIEPYWNIFSIHKTSYAREVLAQYLIGYIHASDLGADGKPAHAQIEDPFADDPERDPRLHTLAAKPRSAETPQDDLADHFLTPTRTFYVRNHMWVPAVEEPDNHVLTIDLPDGSQRTYTVAELRTRFKTHHITSVMQCAGNRRSHMTASAGPTNGLQWGVGAISNAEWEGVKLADVLADAGGGTDTASARTQESLFGPAKHVWFSGMEAYGVSIPLQTAFDPRSDVLLAFGMNGEPLPPDHGAPLRAVVPGHVAARSVKWLNKVVVSEEESPSQWQRRDYKCFGPNQVDVKAKDWEEGFAIQEMPVTSAITRVVVGGKAGWRVRGSGGGTKVVCTGQGEGGVVGEGGEKGQAMTKAEVEKVGSAEKGAKKGDGGDKPLPLSLRGYAYSGGGKEIVRVDVSIDGGKSWRQAKLLDNCRGRQEEARRVGEDISGRGAKYWAWKRWACEAEIPAELVAAGEATAKVEAGSDGTEAKATEGEKTGEVAKKAAGGCMTLIVKATDESYNTQPETQSSVFNKRGNLATAWQRLTLCPGLQGELEGQA